MASCCDPNGLSRVFGKDQAKADARSYRRRGLDREAREIVDDLVARGIAGATVLEVGGGVGAIEIELLREGAASAENIEISPGYEATARELASERGLASRMGHRVADFATDHDAVAPADVVIMHKVVCCYPNMPALVRPAAERARRWLVLTFPAAHWWIRMGLALMNAGQALTRSSYRSFFHEPRTILAIAREAGLRPVLLRRGLIWQVVALER
jgi:magnesium-protoporphyrin O-methyltransferase